MQKGTGWGRQTQPPKHWFVESEVMSHRAGWLRASQEGAGKDLALAFSLSQTLPLESLLQAPNKPPPTAGRGDRRSPHHQRGLVQVCLLPAPFGSGQGGVPPCRSAEPIPVSLARLLWLPERWLGGQLSPILGDSTLPPDSPLALSPLESLTPVGGSPSSRLEELRSESLSLSLETTLPRAHV